MQKFLFSLFVIASLAGTTSLSSCKKDKEASSQDKIVGRWDMDRAFFEISFGGESAKDTTVFENGEYIEFKSDGTMIAHSDDESNTSSWTIDGSKLKLVDPEDGTEEYDIQKLTDNELVLHAKESNGSDFYETTLHLKR